MMNGSHPPPPPPTLPEKDDSNDAPPTSRRSTLRSVLGAGSHRLSDFLNDHLIVARPLTVVAVAALTAVSLAHTPLFFRYRHVQDIPSSFFTGKMGRRRRKYIVGRLVPAPRQSPESRHEEDATTVVRCSIRHLSPAERLLSQEQWRRYHKLLSRFSMFRRSDETDGGNYWPIHLWGLQYPVRTVVRSTTTARPGLLSPRVRGVPPRLEKDAAAVQQHIQALAQQHLRVRCLLYEPVFAAATADVSVDASRRKRPIPNLPPFIDSSIDDDDAMVAVRAQVWVRWPVGVADSASTTTLRRRSRVRTLFSWLFRRGPEEEEEEDLGLYLVRHGLAVPSGQDTLENDDTANTESSMNSKYRNELRAAEQEAALAHVGVWSDPAYRALRPEVMEALQEQQQQQQLLNRTTTLWVHIHRLGSWLRDRVMRRRRRKEKDGG